MSGKHARHRPRWLYLIVGVVAALATSMALFLSPAGAGTASAATVPSQDACHTTNNFTPRGDCGSFHQLYAEDFGSSTVPLGAFSSCAGDGNFKCAGLKAKYGHYYSTLGAYPNGWGDTADPSNHSNGNNRTIGGKYDPPTTTSVLRQSNGDGQMRVHMWHEGSGTASKPAGVNHVSAPVPLKCMGLRYGKFSERFIVRTATDGYKMAHLRYTPNEIDYPEAGGNFHSDPVSEFTHGFSESGADAAGNSAWTGWHTYSQEIVPGHVRFYFDGKLFKTVNADFPDVADWVLQNESSLAGGYAAQGTHVDVDSTWLSCYSYAP